MKGLLMSKYLPLNREVVYDKTSKIIGNYAFGYLKKKRVTLKSGKIKYKNHFEVRYVGRSDTNLTREIIEQGFKNKTNSDGTPLYTHFKFCHTQKTKKDAFLKECKNYHDFGAKEKLDNEIHPARPKGFNQKTLPCSKLGCLD